MKTLFNIKKDFEIQKIVAQGPTSIIYLATYFGKTVAVKTVPFNNATDQDQILAFRKEGATLAILSHPALLKVIELMEWENIPFLITEFIEGESLANYIENSLLAESKVLEMALDLAGALTEVHRRGFVHRDIKPTNLMIQENGKVKLIDFGFAMGRAKILYNNLPGQMIGTGLYCSPEQTGMLKLPVTSRSDLYSLGCVLFECAVGKPPYQGDRLTELLRKHLTEKIPSVLDLRAGFNPTFSRIIAKLMAKDPDDRYQTAEGLAADLKNIDHLNTAEKNDFILGSQDRRLENRAEIALLGREVEVKLLFSSWCDAVAGTGKTVLLEGESGSGKTRLVKEFLRQAHLDGALIFQAKANQGIKTAFEPIREAIRSSAKLDYLEALKSIFRNAQKYSNFTFREEQNKLYERVADLLVKSDEPTIIFIDDIQWLDSASLEVIKKIAFKSFGKRILVICVARVDSSSNVLEEFRRSLVQQPYVMMHLGPLEDSVIEKIATYFLGGRKLEPEFVEHLKREAQGNPLLLDEYIATLLEKGILYPLEYYWAVDTARLNSINIPNNILDIIHNRISNLSQDVLTVLGVAAIIGFEFEFRILSKIFKDQSQKIQLGISEGLSSNLIQASESGYRFVHDRIREAVLNTISEAEFQNFHQITAEAMDADPSSSVSFWYEIARHYSLGKRDKPEKIYWANFQAGLLSLSEYANKEALEFLQTAQSAALQLMNHGEGESRFLTLFESLGVAALRVGDFTLALQQLQRAHHLVANKEDRARLLGLIALNYTSQGDHQNAWDHFHRSLKCLGAAVPKNPVIQVITTFGYWILWTICFRSQYRFGKASGAELKRRKMISEISNSCITSSYFAKGRLMPLIIEVRELYNTHFLGASREAVIVHALFSCIIGGLGRLRLSERHEKIGFDMARQIEQPEALAYSELTGGLAAGFRGDMCLAVSRLKASQPVSKKYMGLISDGVALQYLIRTLHHQGKSHEVIRYYESTSATIQWDKLVGGQMIFGLVYIDFNLLGRHSEASQVFQKWRVLANKYLDKATICAKWGLLLEAAVNEEDFGPKTDELIENRLRIYSSDEASLADYFQVLLIYIERIVNADDPTKRKYGVRKLESSIAKFRLFTYFNLTAFRRCLFMVAESVVAREKFRFKKAKELLHRAKDSAEKVDSDWLRWLVAREQARNEMKQGLSQQAKKSANLAYEIAFKQGWVGRIKQIKKEFFWNLEASTDSRPFDFKSDNFDFPLGTFALKDRALNALLKVSMASVRILDPEHLLRIALDEMIQLFGAERALFFRFNSENEILEKKAGRDSGGNEILESAQYSKRVVERAFSLKTPFLLSGTDEREILESESAIAYNLKSIMAAPVLVGEKILGVFYIDSRIAKGIFSNEDLMLFQALSNYLAISLETARAAKLEIERAEFQNKLKIAHLAGMAEISNGVLHNIGNILTPISLNLDLLQFDFKESKIPFVIKGFELLASHKERLVEFVGQDPKGVKLLQLFIELAATLKSEQDRWKDKINFLRTGVRNVAETVIMQQKYTGIELNFEEENIQKLLKEVLMLEMGNLKRKRIKVEVLDLISISKVFVQRNKLFNVLLNLLKNAEDAMENGLSIEKILKIEATEDLEFVSIRLIDNGIGIAKENLTEIFHYGVSFKKGGQGFGLHISANFMREMGGQLLGDSPGEGKGATFTIKIPKKTDLQMNTFTEVRVAN